MSSVEGESIGFTIAEKCFALLIILIGAIIIHSTSISPDLVYPLFFSVSGLALVLLGIFMILAKTA